MKNLSIIWLFLLLTSCLEEVAIPLNEFTPTLVIEGSIDTQSEVHTVRLSSTADLTGIEEKTLINNALVIIEQLDGAQYPLQEIATGVYQTEPSTLVASEGDTYRLRVALEDGTEFESTWETVPQFVQIQDGYARQAEKVFIDENLIEFTRYFHDLFLEIPNESNDHYFKVENEGWAEVQVGYELQPLFNPPPPPGPTTCWQLRDPIDNQAIALGTNQKITSNSYTIKPLSVEADRPGGYVAVLTVQSMSATSFNYWEDVKEQLDQKGGIFDRPFAPIKGNIESPQNVRVLGYFHAYASSTYEICFSRANLPITNVIPVLTTPVLCTDVWAPATFANQAEHLCQ